MQSTHTTAMALLLLLSAALAAAAEPRTPAAGVALGLASRSSAAVFAPFDAAPGGKPQRLQLAGTKLCVGWSKSDCDGLCLETAPCSDTSPTWTVGPAAKGNATHLRTLTGPCGPAGCCIDFESKVGTLQAFPICTNPFGNQAFQLEPASAGGSGAGVVIKALFLNEDYVSELSKLPGCPLVRVGTCYDGADLLPKGGKVGMTLGSCCDLCHKTTGCVGIVLNPNSAGRTKLGAEMTTCYLKSSFSGTQSPGTCTSGSLGVAFPPPPPPPQPRPINATLSAYWRPTYHPTGFGALASESIGHLQDPSAPYQDASGLWHVFPDCTPETWNAAVLSRYTLRAAGKSPYLGWCHLTSPDLVRWTHQGPAVCERHT